MGAEVTGEDVPQRAIVGFHQDEERHWVAELDCGHTQHMRHDPPWQDRGWVLTPEGRARFIGVRIGCRLCEKPATLKHEGHDGHEGHNDREGD